MKVKSKGQAEPVGITVHLGAGVATPVLAGVDAAPVVDAVVVME